ncbi:MAG TPA: DUF2378 family protein [Polyangiaceae bacterium]|jgi:uncharacterized protein (TIGR02265 family)
MGHEFVPPDCDSPLDVAAYVEGIPQEAFIKGLFASAIVEAARGRGVTLPGARERYHAFTDVPMREYVPVLVAGAQAVHPTLPVRMALRKVGRASRDAFAQTMFGRVVMGRVDGLRAALEAAAKVYPMAMPPARVELRKMTDTRAVLHMTGIYGFLDSHHVGVFEGVARACEVRVTTRVRMISPYTGEIELTW